jgi:glycosyltransferase involved in cell wall biosynthesis
VYGGAQPFTGGDFHGSGVGGTEAGVVVLAEEFARRGMDVGVFTPTQVRSSCQGVRYAPHADAVNRPADLLLAVKSWVDATGMVRAGTTLFWSTDVHVPDVNATSAAIGRAHGVLLMSEYQAIAVARAVANLRERPSAVVGQAVNIADYPTVAEEREDLLMFCSVPDRGLIHLARWLPSIFRAVPSARLVITSDFSLWGMTPARQVYARFFADDPRVTYAGHVDRPALVAWQAQAKVLAYPCQFEEGFCISAAECMAAGVVPVTTDAFALRTTVGDAGILVRGNPGKWWQRGCYRHQFVRAVVRLLRDDRAWRALSCAARQRAFRECAPAVVADRVLSFARECGVNARCTPGTLAG